MEHNQMVVEASANVVVSGKTRTDKSLSALVGASDSVFASLVTKKGKLGAAARHGFAERGMVGIVEQAASGNYKPFVTRAAALLGESVLCRNGADFAALGFLFEARVFNLKNDGMRVLKNGTIAPTAARANLMETIALHVACERAIEAAKAARAAEREAAQISE